MKPNSARPVARPARFCSATPTFKKRSGNASSNGSSAFHPRSAVSRKTRSSPAARSTNASTKARRILSLRPPKLIQSRCRKFETQIAVVPLEPMFHKRNSFPQHGFGNNCLRAFERCVSTKISQQLIDVVSIDRCDMPSECTPDSREVHLEHIRSPAHTLRPIVINHDTKIRQSVMGREHRGFPDLPFIALTITQ